MNHSDCLDFRIFDRIVRIHPADRVSRRAVEVNYGAFRTNAAYADFELAITALGGRYYLETEDGVKASCSDRTALQYDLEKTICIGLELLRRDLLFIHSAVVARDEEAFVLVGESGAGKSTLTWALLQTDFAYGSDELGPIDKNGLVYPYPHALCLKSLPPKPFVVPDCTYRTERTLHIPIQDTKIKILRTALPVTRVFFISHSPQVTEYKSRTLEPAEAVARLYANSLNQLAHKKQGLNLIANLVGKVESQEFIFGDLPLAARKFQDLVSLR